MCKVSVVIPFKDRSELLKRLMGSLDYGLDNDTELLFVDNNSGEEAVSVVRSFARRHKDSAIWQTTDSLPHDTDAAFPEVRIVREERGGAAAARNRGLDLAKGKYVYFFDSDDELCPRMLKEAVRLAEAENVMAVGVRTNVVTPDGRLMRKPFATTADPARQIVANNYATQSILLQTEWARSHARWDERLDYWIDWEWALKILLQKPAMAFLPYSWHKIYIHPHSITGLNYASRLDNIQKAHIAAERDINDATLTQRERARLLRALEGRKILYAAHIYNEGKKDAAHRLLKSVCHDRLSVGDEMRFRLVYMLGCVGIRGVWHLI